MFRYGDTWTPWRLMQNPGFQDDSVEKTLELDASSREAINWITGYSANDSKEEFPTSNVESHVW